MAAWSLRQEHPDAVVRVTTTGAFSDVPAAVTYNVLLPTGWHQALAQFQPMDGPVTLQECQLVYSGPPPEFGSLSVLCRNTRGEIVDLGRLEVCRRDRLGTPSAFYHGAESLVPVGDYVVATMQHPFLDAWLRKHTFTVERGRNFVLDLELANTLKETEVLVSYADGARPAQISLQLQGDDGWQHLGPFVQGRRRFWLPTGERAVVLTIAGKQFRSAIVVGRSDVCPVVLPEQGN